MKTHMLWLLLTGCPGPALFWHNPTSGESAAVRYSVPAEEQGRLRHFTVVKVRRDEKDEWAHVSDESPLIVPVGVTHFRFRGGYWSAPEHQHHHHCSCQPDDVTKFFDALIGIASIGEKKKNEECIVEIALDVADDVDLVFHHSKAGECRVECRSSKGTLPCHVKGDP